MLKIPRTTVDAMIAHAQEEDPNECCGILAGVNGDVVEQYRTTNIEHSPFRYRMDPKELLRVYHAIEDNGWDLLAIYHSHTHTEAHPSQTDVRLATWPDAYYILISLADKEDPVVRAFRIQDGQISEEELQFH